MKKYEVCFLIFLFVISAVLRFPQLGYSHFYGDEAKTLFLRKDVSAKDFFLNQRKGPVQFLVVWMMEKVSGGYGEGFIRLPFAVAGVLNVLVFYYIVRELFGSKTASVSSLLYSLNGLFVAFSRTAQYQSFLLLFGFLAIGFLLRFCKFPKRILLIASSFFLALAFLSHYDAVFFAIIAFMMLFKFHKDGKVLAKDVLLWYVLPFSILTLPFYFPYIVGGYFVEHTIGYLSRRVLGSVNDRISSSSYTFQIYNPVSLTWTLYLFAVIPVYEFLRSKSFLWGHRVLFVWFLVPFIIFELILSNPGTHILNYVIPLTILAGVGIVRFVDGIESLLVKNVFMSFTAAIFLIYFIFDLVIYVPVFNDGYPWRVSKKGSFLLRKADKSYNLFLYGFPYYREWEKMNRFHVENGIRSFYTNDNVTVGEYYLFGIPSVAISQTGQMPQYYIFVRDSQQLDSVVDPIVKKSYDRVKRLEMIDLYKLKNTEG